MCIFLFFEFIFSKNKYQKKITKNCCFKHLLTCIPEVGKPVCKYRRYVVGAHILWGTYLQEHRRVLKALQLPNIGNNHSVLVLGE